MESWGLEWLILCALSPGQTTAMLVGQEHVAGFAREEQVLQLSMVG